MKVNMQGLINRLDDLRERLNELFDKLDDLDQEEIAIEDVEQYFQNDDTFNLSIALDVLEQADKLDKALDIIKEKPFLIPCIFMHENYEEYIKEYGEWNEVKGNTCYTQEEFDLLKEVLQ